MGGLLKAMLKGTKREAFTQVDEGELEYKSSQIFSTTKFNGIIYNTDLDNMSLNIKNQYYP